MSNLLTPDTIHHLDCFDFLARVDDGVVDLAVVDPPYNMKKAGWDTFKSSRDFFDFTFAWLDALLPKLKDTGSLYVFNTPYNAAFILQYLVGKNMRYQNWLTWDKRDGMGGARKRFNREQETILFFTKGDSYTFNADSARLPYQSTARIAHAKTKGIVKNGKRWFPNPHGRLCGDVWHIVSERHKSKVNGKTQKMAHITPKPLEMVERIVRASSNENDLVLDCFAGSGTTAVAARRLNRKFIGCDANAEYARVAMERLRNDDDGQVNFAF